MNGSREHSRRLTRLEREVEALRATTSGEQHTHHDETVTAAHTATTDADGKVVVAHGLNAVPDIVLVAPEGFWFGTVTARDASRFTLQALKIADGTSLAGTQISFRWLAHTPKDAPQTVATLAIEVDFAADVVQPVEVDVELPLEFAFAATLADPGA